MRLASLKHRRDGRLVLAGHGNRVLPVPEIALTLQAALDDWERAAPLLAAAMPRLDGEGIVAPADAFAAPLPRAYQWADGSAYLSHVELTRRARGAEMPAEFLTDPLMYQGGSDSFLGPVDPIPLLDPAFGLDLEAEIAVVTGDVPMGIDAESALGFVRLLVLVNDVSLRGLVPNELGKGFGFFQSKPSSAFAPYAVTPEALGPAWSGGRLRGVLEVHRNETRIGRLDPSADMQFHFGQLIAHAARTRPLCAGTIIGGGTVSNRDPQAGVACLVEARMREKLAEGAPRTPWLSAGETVRIAYVSPDGDMPFGMIRQRIAGG